MGGEEEDALEELVESAVVEAVASTPVAKAAGVARPESLSLVINLDETVKENGKTTEDVARDLVKKYNEKKTGEKEGIFSMLKRQDSILSKEEKQEKQKEEKKEEKKKNEAEKDKKKRLKSGETEESDEDPVF